LLAANELLGRVNGYWVPMTLDTGASVIPREFVSRDAFTGKTEQLRGFVKNVPAIKAPIAKVDLETGGRTVTREVAVISGETLGWEGVFSSYLGSREELDLLLELQKAREALTKGQARYIPPKMGRGGKALGAIPWEEPPPLETDKHTPVMHDSTDQSAEYAGKYKPQTQDTEAQPMPTADKPVDQGGNRVEEEDDSSKVDGLVLNGCASDNDEEEGVLGDCADRTKAEEGGKSGPLNGTREELVKTSLADTTLAAIRKLAKQVSNGYQLEDVLLMKYQLDEVGQTSKRLCVPQPFRNSCMEVARDKFVHRGKNKVAVDIARNFYWPSLWRDVAAYCKACEVCQRFSKAKPRHAPMVEREVVTVPSERVCIDLVGPLLKAQGGFEFLLTMIDVATRWPEAVPLRKATAPIIVRHLLDPRHSEADGG